MIVVQLFLSFLSSKSQGSKGIRQWPMNLCTFLMTILKITLPVEYYYWLKRLDTQLNETTNQNSVEVPKVVELTNKKSKSTPAFYK